MSEPTNSERAARVEAFLKAYQREYLPGDEELGDPVIVDVITDVLHWCAINLPDVNPEGCLRAAQIHFDAEQRGE